MTLSSWVDCAFHAVAVDERRRPFVPTLWLQQASAREHGQRIEQRWFTGVHSDVGGGYPWAERGLATLALRWMIDRVTAACRLELDPSALDGAPPSESALHDSLSLWYRLWAPANRTIDGGLGHHGARDDMRITDEYIDESRGQVAREVRDGADAGGEQALHARERARVRGTDRGAGERRRRCRRRTIRRTCGRRAAAGAGLNELRPA